MIDLSKPFPRQPAAVQWMILVFLSGIFVGTLETLRVPAALLIGPMGAAILATINGVTLRLPPWVFQARKGLLAA